MAVRSPGVGEPHKTATAEEVSSAISALTTTQLLRLREHARFRTLLCGTNASLTPEDLLQEAVMRTLNGKRHWNKAISLETHLVGTMRSICSHSLQRLNSDKPVPKVKSTPVMLEGSDALDYLPSHAPDAVRQLAAKETLERVYEMFRDDPQVVLVLAALRDGWSSTDRDHHGLSELEFQAALKRMRRALRANLPPGQTDVF
jgi:DNA-directed RNA polymerase specialized sigma24 family protein